jgi:replicative DNA helicase
LASLDEAVSFMRGRYTILAGTTSMGKTAMSQWISYSAAKAGFGVGFVSLEMTEIDLARRMNSIESKIPYQVQDRAMSEVTFRKVVDAARAQESLPIEIFSARVNDLPAIVSEAKKLQKKQEPNGNFKGMGLLVVDYIQLVKGKGTDFEVLSSVANDLKQVAKLLNVHVLALAQVGTKVMERENPRPGLSDMRGSGDLGMAPDNVIFCHREEYYMGRAQRPKKTDELADFEADFEKCKGKMELIIGKARMGDLSTITVGCDMGTNRFWDINHTQEMEF